MRRERPWPVRQWFARGVGYLRLLVVGADSRLGLIVKPSQFTSGFSNAVSYVATQTTRAFGTEADSTNYGSTQNEIGLPYRNSVYLLPVFHTWEVTPCSR